MGIAENILKIWLLRLLAGDEYPETCISKQYLISYTYLGALKTGIWVIFEYIEGALWFLGNYLLRKKH